MTSTYCDSYLLNITLRISDQKHCCTGYISWGGIFEFWIRYRQSQLHRLPRMHGCLQIRAWCPHRGQSDLGQVCRKGSVPRHAQGVFRHALQSLWERTLCWNLPDPGVVHASGRHCGFQQRTLHRLQIMHTSLPLRRDLHWSWKLYRGQVQLLLAQSR